MYVAMNFVYMDIRFEPAGRHVDLSTNSEEICVARSAEEFRRCVDVKLWSIS